MTKKTEKAPILGVQIAQNVTTGAKFQTTSLNGICFSWAKTGFQMYASYFKACGFESAEALRDELKTRVYNSYCAKDSARGVGDSFVPTIWKNEKEGDKLELIPCDSLGELTKEGKIRVPAERTVFDKVPRLKKDGTPATNAKGAPVFDYVQRIEKTFEYVNITLRAYKKRDYSLQDAEAAFKQYLKDSKEIHELQKDFESIANEDRRAIYAKATGRAAEKAFRAKVDEMEEKTQREESKK
jgi:hypothetical protein